VACIKTSEPKKLRSATGWREQKNPSIKTVSWYFVLKYIEQHAYFLPPPVASPKQVRNFMTELEECRSGWPGIVLHPGSAVPAMS
jgi:hypothetical protein